MSANDLRAQLQRWADARQAIHDHEAATGDCDTQAFQDSEDEAVSLCHEVLAWFDATAEDILDALTHEAEDLGLYDGYDDGRYDDDPSPYNGTYSEE